VAPCVKTAWCPRRFQTNSREVEVDSEVPSPCLSPAFQTNSREVEVRRLMGEPQRCLQGFRRTLVRLK